MLCYLFGLLKFHFVSLEDWASRHELKLVNVFTVWLMLNAIRGKQDFNPVHFEVGDTLFLE